MGRLLRFDNIIHRIEQLTAIRAIRSALVNMIPVLIIGAFALILQTLPVTAYQDWLATPSGNVFLQLFMAVYCATFGVLSVYMTMSIARAYIRLKEDRDTSIFGSICASLLSFFILSGAYLPEFGIDSLGPKSMFLAIITGLGASAVFRRLYIYFRKGRNDLFSMGADQEFNKALSTFLPIAITAALFAAFNFMVVSIANVDSFRAGLNQFFNWVFSFGSPGFGKGFLFVLLSSVLWMFGIHGSDTLEGVMETYFVPGLVTNAQAAAAGNAPTQILTKEFFDCFVLMGGCGATICLLIAILLFSRNRARRNLGFAAAFPMIFNINEMMVFGLPVIFNPVMLIPFITVPLVCYTVAYIAISTGLVPMITSAVAWTTPVVLGGFRATGSMAGGLLQIVNIIIGVAIYYPFVKLLDRQSENRLQREFEAFTDYFRENERELGVIHITELGNSYGEFAKELCAALKAELEQGMAMSYQPQYDYDGNCIGAEALLRWNHPIHGALYPPLVVKLAEEGGFLPELERSVLRHVLEDRPAVLERFGQDIKLSFNVTGTTVVREDFLQYCRTLDKQYNFRDKNLCLEVTEQATLSFDDDTVNALRRLKDLGLILAIDDFSMGQTSVHYLKDNLFEAIKLDGSLVQGLFLHSNSREIISSIVGLASTLNLTVLAEYVETEQQRDALHEIGCNNYQGYLYSPAILL